MLNLLRSDLYRMTRIRGLRGNLWQYASVLLFIACLEVGLTWFILQSGMGPAENVNLIKGLATPSSFLGSTMLGSFSVLALAASFGMAEYTFADLSEGYVKSLVSSPRGRALYLNEKILLAGIWSALMLALGCIFHLVILQVFLTMPYSFAIQGPDNPLAFVLWLLGTWLATWAITVIAMIAVAIFRKKLLVYIFTLTLISSPFPLTLSALAFSSGGMLSFLQPIAPVLTSIATWMPNSVLQAFSDRAGAVGQRGSHAEGRTARSLAILYRRAARRAPPRLPYSNHPRPQEQPCTPSKRTTSQRSTARSTPSTIST